MNLVRARGRRCAVVLCCAAARARAGSRSASAARCRSPGRSRRRGAIQKVATEVYVEDLNKRGGLLGRKVEMGAEGRPVAPDMARTLYEQLVTVDKVDLIWGPYGTAIDPLGDGRGAALQQDAAAQQLRHAEAGQVRHAVLDLGRRRSTRRTSGRTWCSTRPPRRRSRRRPSPSSPASSRRCTSSRWARARWRRSAACTEVLFLEYEFGNRDFGPIAARIKDAKPDFLWVGANGIDPVLMLDAMKKIDYQPPMHFYMFPAPGPMVKMPGGEELARASPPSRSTRRSPTTRAPRSSSRRYHERGAKAGLPDTSVDLLASIAYSHVAGARGGGERHQEPRRQDARRVAAQEQGRHHHGPPALGRAAATTSRARTSTR